MKVSLIEPKAPDYHIYSRWAIPRLGPPQMATILRDQGHDVKIYHEDLLELSGRRVWEILKSDLVGISITSSTAPRGYAMGRLLRLRGVPVVYGGVHPTFMPEEPLNYGDYVMVGEAEETFPELVNTLANDGDLDEVPNLYYKEDGEPVFTYEKKTSPAPDDLPIPDLSLIEGHENLKIYPIMTTRGCPHGCTFCCVTSMFGRKYRLSSIERVLAQVERYQGRHIFFCDDNFTVSTDRCKELLSEMLRRDILPSRWNAQVRADTFKDDELLDLMRRTNCGRVFVGFESIDDQVLEEYHKHQTVQDIKNCIAGYHEHGIAVHGMFMFGAEGDTMETFPRTIGFAEEHNLDTAQFLVLTPVPGSELFNRLDEEGRIFTYDWSLYDGHHVVFEPQHMSPLDLQLGSLRANRMFYSARSSLRCLSGLRLTTALLRYAGKHVLKKWHKSNSDFLNRLRRWQKGAADFPQQFSLRPHKAELQPAF